MKFNARKAYPSQVCLTFHIPFCVVYAFRFCSRIPDDTNPNRHTKKEEIPHNYHTTTRLFDSPELGPNLKKIHNSGLGTTTNGKSSPKTQEKTNNNKRTEAVQEHPMNGYLGLEIHVNHSVVGTHGKLTERMGCF